MLHSLVVLLVIFESALAFAWSKIFHFIIILCSSLFVTVLKGILVFDLLVLVQALALLSHIDILEAITLSYPFIRLHIASILSLPTFAAFFLALLVLSALLTLASCPLSVLLLATFSLLSRLLLFRAHESAVLFALDI